MPPLSVVLPVVAFGKGVGGKGLDGDGEAPRWWESYGGYALKPPDDSDCAGPELTEAFADELTAEFMLGVGSAKSLFIDGVEHMSYIGVGPSELARL